MEIKDIEKIIYNNNVIEIHIGIELDVEKSSIWELEDPNVLVVYNPKNNPHFQNMDLINNGMKVHGYEISEIEEKEIINFLQKKNFCE